MRILALVNQKGGCGKTTSAIQVASLLARSGKRTLLVDLDPQGHATLGLGAAVPARERSLAAVLARSGLDEAALSLRSIVVPVSERLWLAPSGVELAEIEAGAARGVGSEERLAEHLAPLVRELDRVVIDAPPALGLLTLNALMAASDALIPVEPSLFSLHGLARLVELMKLLGGRGGHRISFRVFLNAFDGRARFAQRTLDEVRRAFPAETMSTTVRSSVCVREAAARGLPVDRFAPSAPITQDYEALVSELERGMPDQVEAEPATKGTGLVAAPDGLYLTRHDVGPERVLLAGNFNAWMPDSGVELKRHGDGSWTKFVRLPPGRYEYKLVVDGRWVADPLNPQQVPNDAGSANSVLEIGR